jgi:hypothetical protein
MIEVYLRKAHINHKFEYLAEAEKLIRETFDVEPDDFHYRPEPVNAEGEEVMPVIINGKHVATVYIEHE